MKFRVWLVLGGLLLMSGALAPGPAHAESSFTALSSATAIDVILTNGDLPLVTAVQAAGPSAGTSLDSTGQGTAFASNPYPGTTVAQLPGVAAGLSGLPIPGYPFFVATTTDDEPARFTQPGLDLQAKCQNGDKPGCAAASLAGSGPGTAQAGARVAHPSAEEVVASAQADTSSFSIPGDITLSGVHTSATAVLRNGKLVRRSELTVSRLTVGGTQAFSISAGKVFVAGTDIPVPFSELASALEASGVKAEFFASSQSKDGVVAPALRLTTELPGGPAQLTKPSHVVYTVGGADASVTLGAFRADSPPTGGSLTGGSPSDAAPRGDTASPADARPAPTGGLEAVPGSAPVAAPEPPPQLTEPAPLVMAAPASSPAQPFDVADSYLALILFAVVCFGATQAIRIFGVRFQWTL